MKQDDFQCFCTLMVWLAEKYPVGKDKQGNLIPRLLVPESLPDYFRALSDMPLSAVERGVWFHFANSEFFPDRPASLRRSIEAAPIPRAVRFPSPNRVLLPEVPPELSRKRMKACFEYLNAKFGTSLKA